MWGRERGGSRKALAFPCGWLFQDQRWDTGTGREPSAPGLLPPGSHCRNGVFRAHPVCKVAVVSQCQSHVSWDRGGVCIDFQSQPLALLTLLSSPASLSATLKVCTEETAHPPRSRVLASGTGNNFIWEMRRSLHPLGRQAHGSHSW